MEVHLSHRGIPPLLACTHKHTLILTTPLLHWTLHLIRSQETSLEASFYLHISLKTSSAKPFYNSLPSPQGSRVLPVCVLHVFILKSGTWHAL